MATILASVAIIALGCAPTPKPGLYKATSEVDALIPYLAITEESQAYAFVREFATFSSDLLVESVGDFQSMTYSPGSACSEQGCRQLDGPEHSFKGLFADTLGNPYIPVHFQAPDEVPGSQYGQEKKIRIQFVAATRAEFARGLLTDDRLGMADAVRHSIDPQSSCSPVRCYDDERTFCERFGWGSDCAGLVGEAFP